MFLKCSTVYARGWDKIILVFIFYRKCYTGSQIRTKTPQNTMDHPESLWTDRFYTVNAGDPWWFTLSYLFVYSVESISQGHKWYHSKSPAITLFHSEPLHTNKSDFLQWLLVSHDESLWNIFIFNRNLSQGHKFHHHKSSAITLFHHKSLHTSKNNFWLNLLVCTVLNICLFIFYFFCRLKTILTHLIT